MTDDDIKLPPLPRVQMPLIEADVSLLDISVLARWCERIATNHARAAVLADRKRRQSEAEEVCAEAYQVVGSLLSDLGIFETDHAKKILDNLSQAKMVHKDALPWPSFERLTLRDYFAAKAMAAMVASPDYADGEWFQEDIALQAYQMADTMLKERENKS